MKKNEENKDDNNSKPKIQQQSGKTFFQELSQVQGNKHKRVIETIEEEESQESDYLTAVETVIQHTESLSEKSVSKECGSAYRNAAKITSTTLHLTKAQLDEQFKSKSKGQRNRFYRRLCKEDINYDS